MKKGTFASRSLIIMTYGPVLHHLVKSPVSNIFSMPPLLLRKKISQALEMKAAPFKQCSAEI
jgi:hypothetical protein